MAIGISGIALLVSVGFSVLARQDEQALRDIEDHRRLRELVADFPALQSALLSGDPVAAQVIPVRAFEAVDLAEDLGDQVTVAEYVGLALALLSVADAARADALLETAASRADSVTERIMVLRVRAQTAAALEDYETSRRHLDEALSLSTAENMGSQLLEDDIDALTLVQALGLELNLGNCARAAQHVAELREIRGRFGPAAEQIGLLPTMEDLEQVVAICEGSS